MPLPEEYQGLLRDKRGAIRLPCAEMVLGVHLHTIPNRHHPLLPEHRGDAQAWRDIVRADPCAWCNKPAGKDSTSEHVITRADGGGEGWPNIVGACFKCNHERGAATIIQYLMQRACLDKLRGRRVTIATIHELVRARYRR